MSARDDAIRDLQRSLSAQGYEDVHPGLLLDAISTDTLVKLADERRLHWIHCADCGKHVNGWYAFGDGLIRCDTCREIEAAKHRPGYGCGNVQCAGCYPLTEVDR